MQRKRIAPDGSCLFTSIDYLVSGVERADCAANLRRLCVTAILSEPARFTAETLGEQKSVSEYCEWITRFDVYGGANEIEILAEHFKVCIAVISCIPFSPAGLLARYGDSSCERVAYVLYNGQHYDAIEGDNGVERIFRGTESDDAQAVALAETVKDERETELLTRLRKKLKCSCGAIFETPALWQTHCGDAHADDEDFDYCCEEIEVAERVASATDD